MYKDCICKKLLSLLFCYSTPTVKLFSEIIYDINFVCVVPEEFQINTIKYIFSFLSPKTPTSSNVRDDS